MPTFGSLFAGIGGMDLGLERAGWSCRWQVEIDPWCQSILTKHWPDVPKYGDVKDVGDELERVELVAGGFPCQPVSKAGKRKAQEDTRWLWPEVCRLLGLLRPRFALLENVPGLLNVNSGRAFGEVLGDLAACGYDAEWECVPAAAVGAPHLRDRVFIVAYPNNSGRVHGQAQVESAEGRLDALGQPESSGADVAHANGNGLQARRLHVRPGEPRQAASESPSPRPDVADPDSIGWDGRPWIFGPAGWRQLANSGGWLPEPGVGRVANGVPRRVDRIRGLGNAVVPQQVEWIGRRLIECSAHN